MKLPLQCVKRQMILAGVAALKRSVQCAGATDSNVFRFHIYGNGFLQWLANAYASIDKVPSQHQATARRALDELTAYTVKRLEQRRK